ncbi:hypothetical protein AAFP35_03955 [Gordonia sp. CPCC 206044]|uniref:hypothetical protein n=1 Tax=Gordonia sp. CPCC 206044 TaxID=3140793 RepID=UPI003AF350E2
MSVTVSSDAGQTVLRTVIGAAPATFTDPPPHSDERLRHRGKLDTNRFFAEATGLSEANGSSPTATRFSVESNHMSADSNCNPADSNCNPADSNHAHRSSPTTHGS